MLWIARGCWLVLAFTTAATIDDATTDWSDASRVTIAIGAWGLWAIGALALLAPRPWGFTVLRVAVTVAVVASVASATEAAAATSAAAIVVALVATATVTGATVADAGANGIAYGYEERFCLRAPFPLVIGGIPVAAALVAAGAIAGPLLCANQVWWWGLVAVVVGWPFGAFLALALHRLDRRWLVMVPAGVVVADPLTLTDPVLFNEDRLARIDAAPTSAPPGALDLRVGTAVGSLVIQMRDSAPIAHRTARGEATLVRTDTVLVTPLRAGRVVRALARRPRVRE